MKLETKYNLGDKVYIVIEPQKNSAKYLVEEGKITGVNISVEDNYRTEIYKTNHKRLKVDGWETSFSSYYLETNKDHLKIFTKKVEAEKQAEKLRQKLLEEKKEDLKSERKYQAEKLKNQMEAIQKKAEKLKIKL